MGLRKQKSKSKLLEVLVEQNYWITDSERIELTCRFVAVGQTCMAWFTVK